MGMQSGAGAIPPGVHSFRQLLPGTFGLGGTQGLSYTYRAQLEVVPMPPNPDADQSYLAIYSGYGDEGPDVLNLLSVLVNDRLTVLP
jgi:hypothetical protein